MEEEDDNGLDFKVRRQKSSGSVKRARQRAAVGLPPEGYRDPLEPEPLRIASNRTTPNRTPPSRTPPLRSENDSPQYPEYSPHGSRRPPKPPLRSTEHPSPTTSSPTDISAPRWPPPLQSPADVQKPSDAVLNSSSPRGPPPQRPPRPDAGPPIPDQPSINYWENGFVHPLAMGGRSLEDSDSPVMSSFSGPIPEFPIPFIPPTVTPPRRNLGPPPSARKGGSNFYPQNTFVTPIPEEQSETHSSFASSHVIPASWGDGPPDYSMGSGIDEEGDDESYSPNSTNNGRESRVGEHDESTGLVRKVSIGKPGKPALKSIKGKEEDGAPFGGQAGTGQELQSGPNAGVETFLAPSSNDNSPEGTPHSRIAKTSYHASQPGSASPSSPVDPTVAKILGGLEKGGALSTGGTATPLTSTAPSMSEKGARRPPRLNLDAVKEGEPRSSATSLPELIRRATRLASNLDRGRTASRIGILEMLEKEKSQHSRNGSISDMLDAFPSPSLTTPTGGRHGSRFSSPLPHSGLNRGFTASDRQLDYQRTSYRRRCCGMPVWAFILLCIILLLLVAAAVVIPITLVVLPRQNNDSGSGTVGQCQKSFPCSNDGTSFVHANACRCICANGFTGASCGMAPENSCVTANFSASSTVYENATIGAGVERIISSANRNFSLPLQPINLLAVFSSQNLTCTSETALITFDSRTQRRDILPPSLTSAGLRILELLPQLKPSAIQLHPRAAASHGADSDNQAAVTSNGLVFAAPTRANGGSSPQATSTSVSSNPSSSSSPSTSGKVTPTILDFARTAVLLILQERGLPAAFSAQESMQALLGDKVGNTFNTSVADVGANVSIDWRPMIVNLGNGTSFGGMGSA
ncbi:MAG: hypothetical protein Q9190_007004 [Brigantiaea leucoxantha]